MYNIQWLQVVYRSQSALVLESKLLRYQNKKGKNKAFLIKPNKLLPSFKFSVM